MKVSDGKYDQIAAKTNGRCAYCGAKDDLQIDHMIPVVQGGGNKLSNLVLACRRCNNLKKGRTVEQFRYYILGGIRKYFEKAEAHLELYGQYISVPAHNRTLDVLEMADGKTHEIATESEAVWFYMDELGIE